MFHIYTYILIYKNKDIYIYIYIIYIKQYYCLRFEAKTAYQENTTLIRTTKPQYRASKEELLKEATISIPDGFNGAKKSFTVSGPSDSCSSIGVLWLAKTNSYMCIYIYLFLFCPSTQMVHIYIWQNQLYWLRCTQRILSRLRGIPISGVGAKYEYNLYHLLDHPCCAEVDRWPVVCQRSQGAKSRHKDQQEGRCNNFHPQIRLGSVVQSCQTNGRMVGQLEFQSCFWIRWPRTQKR